MEVLNGKIVLITGASRGIGLACAKVFASQGCNLILVARRKDRLEEIRKKIRAIKNVEVHIIAVDLNKTEDVAQHLSKIPHKLKSIYILINNAGIVTTDSKFQEIKPSDIDCMIDTNFKAMALLRSLSIILCNYLVKHKVLIAPQIQS
ncbi:MAG: SDR family NAD(P)-dependent oxidoreductase [Bacteroidota bacterium]